MKTVIEILNDIENKWNNRETGTDFLEGCRNGGIYALREAKERIQKETQWISVKDDIPELGVPVITLDIHGTFAVMKRNRIDGWSQPGFGVSLDSITHWMPLPLPPHE